MYQFAVTNPGLPVRVLILYFANFTKKPHKTEKNSPWEERIPAIEICEDPEIDDGKIKLVHKKYKTYT